MSYPQALDKVWNEFRQPELHKQIIDSMSARVLVVSYVGVEMTYNYGILDPETSQILPQIGEVIHGGGGGGYAPTSGV